MTYMLERAEKKGDRSRARISTPAGQVTPAFKDGKVVVFTENRRVKDALVKRHGFTAADIGPASKLLEEAAPKKTAPPPIATPKPKKPKTKKLDLDGEGDPFAAVEQQELDNAASRRAASKAKKKTKKG